MAELRFLVVRLGSLGDIVHTFPAVAGLRESFPDSEIVWLTHPRWQFLVESSSLASQVWTVDTRSWSSLREAIYRVRQTEWTASIDYQGLWKSAALPFLGPVKRRIGFSSATIREFAVPLLYTDRVRSTARHIADQNGELSLRAGARNSVAAFSLHAPGEDETTAAQYLRDAGIDRYIVLSPGGGWRSKCWPPERFGVLCGKIRATLGLRCIVNYGPAENELATAVRAASGEADPLLYDGELGPLMGLLRRALCIVGADTGPLHLAVALGTPAVALFGPTDPVRNGPYRQVNTGTGILAEDIVLRAPGVTTTHRRGDQPHPSMLAIEVDAVFDAVRRRIGDLK
jgi:lipopolysaccharide heptosyltransferase I